MSLVGKFAHLPGRPRSSETTPMLEKIASQVKPIMKKRGWKVGVLGEFFPENPALLGININKGQRINLRLRPHDNPTGFYDLEQLVLVMLHELTHIVVSPHDASFYKLLGELEEEYYDLKRKGYSGEGFHSDGNRLHGTRLNEYEGRRRGLAAAEKRFQQARVMGRGGVLGGSKVGGGKSMREILAEAAERRLKDDKTCKVDSKEAEAEARKAQEESVVVDATGLDSDSDEDSGQASGSGTAGGSIKSEPGIKTEVSSEAGGSSAAGEGSKKRPLREGPFESAGTLDEPIVIDDEDDPPSVSRPTRPKLATTGSTSSSRTVSAATTPGTGDGASGASSTRAATTSKGPRPASGTSRAPPAAPAPSRPKTAPNPPPPATEWSCPTCTLINPMSARACDACQTPRPVQQTADGWFCEFCGAGPREMGFWSCIECGWVRKWG